MCIKPLIFRYISVVILLCHQLSLAVVCACLTAGCAQAALQLDIEDINAYCQRKDALEILKRMPPAQQTSLPSTSGPSQMGNHASSDPSAGAA